MGGRQNIHEFVLQCKGYLEEGIVEWGLLVIVILVGICAFGLGRYSALEEARPPISIYEAPSLAKPQGMYLGGLYEASKTGSVYYYPWCSGAVKIAPNTAIWFATEAAAQVAGYTPAKNCKGLGNE